MKTQIISQKEYTNQNIDGTLVFDGDGDGAGAAAIWLMQNPGKYVSFTNQQKSQRDLVKNVFETIPEEYIQNKRAGVFDIAAQQNREALEQLVNLGVNIDFIDHHSNISINGISDFSQPDSRQISTAILAYEHYKKKLTDEENEKAKDLAILGLANDGKSRAAKKIFENVNQEKMAKLCYYGTVLNYAANLGHTLDFTEILKGLSSENVLDYLENSKVAEVANEMETSTALLLSKTRRTSKKGLEVYTFPNQSSKDKILANGVYSPFLNSEMEKDPENLHVGIIHMEDGKYKVAIRGPNALSLAEKISKHYNGDYGGRETAAGFSTTQTVETSELIAKLGE